MDYQRVASEMQKEVDERLKGNLGKQISLDENSTDSFNYRTFKTEQKEEFSLNTFYEKNCSFSEKYMGFINLG